MAYDMPIPGYRNRTVNTLRLWAAKATEEFDLEDFIRGDYVAAVEAKTRTETISKVLYPPDDTGSGKELRLKQQYFFVSATLQDIIRRYKRERSSFADFPDKVQIQLNDTHPAVAIPELMRLLMDEEGMEWNEAWASHAAPSPTPTTPYFRRRWRRGTSSSSGPLLPRHLELMVQEIDRRLRARVADAFPGDTRPGGAYGDLAGGQVRMASLAIAGSHTVNGVAELHGRILRESVFRDFYELWPERFTWVTNGVTQRRWLLKSNPSLSELITSRIGDGWTVELEQLREIEQHADDPAFRSGGAPPRPTTRCASPASSGISPGCARHHRDLRRAGQADARVQAAAAQRTPLRRPVPPPARRPGPRRGARARCSSAARPRPPTGPPS
jgi:glycogen phosphorylase